ncbi:YybH family protein [Lichenibacterium ramalinae]|uniref:Nuclear transport factor 2 family protein n=1 Tax=Lichenibacterium ramalinae TaxID=2316527 RepID=A0A4Q2RDU6_9HYPH|nr:nuclear transport factor 2 family protein [Lichenibacterium ramalinae]RYB04205.1 nuclear transport factor 2 family protein [Lichenibacterium ramalinae]
MRKLLIALLLCGAAAPAVAQDVSGAREASGKFTAALASGDAQTAASFLTDGAVALPPGRGPINGKAQIQQFLGNMTRAVKNLKYTTDDLQPIDDNTAREVGTFAFKMQNNTVDGKYLLIWTKVGGDWKVAADMWNRSATGGKGGRGGGRQGGTGAGGRSGGAEGAGDAE